MARPAANIHIASQRVQENAAALEQAASGERHHLCAEIVANIVADCAGILDNMEEIGRAQAESGGRASVDRQAVKNARERCVCNLMVRGESAEGEGKSEKKGRVATEPQE